jgi:hypothetical protein
VVGHVLLHGNTSSSVGLPDAPEQAGRLGPAQLTL